MKEYITRDIDNNIKEIFDNINLNKIIDIDIKKQKKLISIWHIVQDFYAISRR